MSKLLARILLALLMLPVCSMVYVISGAILFRTMIDDSLSWFICTVLTAAAVVSYWTLLWLKTVRWTTSRIALTGAAIGFAACGGAVVGAVMEEIVADDFGIFVGGVSAMLGWLVMTIMIWRETAAERADRVRGAGVDLLVCPQCGYNMTGLRSTQCPECGGQYTISEIVASQPRQDLKELGDGV